MTITTFGKNKGMKREQRLCSVIVFSTLMLLCYCGFIKFFASNRRSYINTESYEPQNAEKWFEDYVQCTDEIRRDYTLLVDKEFALRCYSNPFVVWAGIVSVSVVWSTLFFC